MPTSYMEVWIISRTPAKAVFFHFFKRIFLSSDLSGPADFVHVLSVDTKTTLSYPISRAGPQGAVSPLWVRADTQKTSYSYHRTT